jgi:serine/threonine protein kinase
MNMGFLDINDKCRIFHKFSNDLLMMLFLFKKIRLVHLDIKIDNILVDEKDGIIQYKLSDDATVRPNKFKLHSIYGTDSYVSPKLILDLEKNNAEAKHIYDCYSMAITESNIFSSLFNINIRTLQYFPFTNEESTFESKKYYWSDKIRYDGQVELLKSFFRKSLELILKTPGITEDNKKNIENNIEMILILFLSNNPFPNIGQNLEKETYDTIEAYLKFYNLIPSTN